jgi:hypothetical protein
MARIYVETTIPSFYFENRTEPEMVARRRWTRLWWDIALKRDELFTSLAVFDELNQGDYLTRSSASELAKSVEVLDINDEVFEIVQFYISHKLMPADPSGDALHLALASYHSCDFLVTWNCAHLANANKFGHIRRINGIIGVSVPSLVTPLELLGSEGKP